MFNFNGLSQRATDYQYALRYIGFINIACRRTVDATEILVICVVAPFSYMSGHRQASDACKSSNSYSIDNYVVRSLRAKKDMVIIML